MGFLRRRSEPIEEFEPPPGLQIPDGMTAVPAEKIVDWAAQLAAEASEMAVSRRAPDIVDLSAKVALGNALGRERASGFPGGTNVLGYNLYIHGYWCRAAEMQAIDATEVSSVVGGYLQVAHDQQLWGDDWFVTLGGASHALAGADEVPDEIPDAFRSALPQDLGEDFRDYYATTTIFGITRSVDAQHPGASSPLSPVDMRTCWEVGYWMRAVSVSIPDEAHAEFARRAEGRDTERRAAPIAASRDEADREFDQEIDALTRDLYPDDDDDDGDDDGSSGPASGSRGEIYPAWVTVERTRPPAGRLINRLRYVRTGSSENEAQVTPGQHMLHAAEGFSRRAAEDMHNWALDHGFESELMEHRERGRLQPAGWTLRVRRPQDSEPRFFHEETGMSPGPGIVKLD